MLRTAAQATAATSAHISNICFHMAIPGIVQ
jgi:hypothetical protein